MQHKFKYKMPIRFYVMMGLLFVYLLLFIVFWSFFRNNFQLIILSLIPIFPMISLLTERGTIIVDEKELSFGYKSKIKFNLIDIVDVRFGDGPLGKRIYIDYLKNGDVRYASSKNSYDSSAQEIVKAILTKVEECKKHSSVINLVGLSCNYDRVRRIRRGDFRFLIFFESFFALFIIIDLLVLKASYFMYIPAGLTYIASKIMFVLAYKNKIKQVIFARFLYVELVLFYLYIVYTFVFLVA